MDSVYIDKVLKGDSEAFRYFLRTYKDMGYNIAMSILKDDFFAEEVVQDAFIKAYRSLKSFKKKSTFKTWFYRIVVNEAFQRLKKIKKEQEWLETRDTDVYESLAAAEEEDQGNSLMRKAINTLLPNERLALNLFYFDEYKVLEIVEITGWSKSNTKVILHRARKNLHAVLEGRFKNKN